IDNLTGDEVANHNNLRLRAYDQYDYQKFTFRHAVNENLALTASINHHQQSGLLDLWSPESLTFVSLGAQGRIGGEDGVKYAVEQGIGVDKTSVELSSGRFSGYYKRFQGVGRAGVDMQINKTLSVGASSNAQGNFEFHGQWSGEDGSFAAMLGMGSNGRPQAGFKVDVRAVYDWLTGRETTKTDRPQADTLAFVPTERDRLQLAPEAGEPRMTDLQYQADWKKLYRMKVTLDPFGQQVTAEPRMMEHMQAVLRDPEAAGIGFIFGQVPTALTEKDASYGLPLRYIAPEDLREAGIFRNLGGFYIRLQQNGRMFSQALGDDTRVILPKQFSQLSTRIDSAYPVIVEDTFRSIDRELQFASGLGVLRVQGVGSIPLTRRMLEVLTDASLENGTLQGEPTYSYNKKTGEMNQKMTAVNFTYRGLDISGALLDLGREGIALMKQLTGKTFTLPLKAGNVSLTMAEMSDRAAEFGVAWSKDNAGQNILSIPAAAAFEKVPTFVDVNGHERVAVGLSNEFKAISRAYAERDLYMVDGRPVVGSGLNAAERAALNTSDLAVGQVVGGSLFGRFVTRAQMKALGEREVLPLTGKQLPSVTSPADAGRAPKYAYYYDADLSGRYEEGEPVQYVLQGEPVPAGFTPMKALGIETFNAKTEAPLVPAINLPVASAPSIWLSSDLPVLGAAVAKAMTLTQIPAEQLPSLTVSGLRKLDAEIPVRGVTYSPVAKGETPWTLDWEAHLSDITLMKKMGVTTIRTYRPITSKLFLDTLAANGMQAIIGFPSYDDTKAGPDIQGGGYLDYIRAYKNHPAVRMWEFGNEYNYHPEWFNNDVNVWYAGLEKAARAAKAVDAAHKISTAHGEVPAAEVLKAVPSVDVWGLNIYRGRAAATVFGDWQKSSQAAGVRGDLQFYISETGEDAFNAAAGREDQTTQAQVNAAIWQDLAAHAQPGKFLGVTYM
ncbi:MAG: hypothetical protein PHE83_19230, partial [Opitutaceae bacterium]|nr:hypothetical protein [Opitutaceae bacterium]